MVVRQGGRRGRPAVGLLTGARFMLSNLVGGMDDWVSDGPPTA